MAKNESEQPKLTNLVREMAGEIVPGAGIMFLLYDALAATFPPEKTKQLTNWLLDMRETGLKIGTREMDIAGTEAEIYRLWLGAASKSVDPFGHYHSFVSGDQLVYWWKNGAGGDLTGSGDSSYPPELRVESRQSTLSIGVTADYESKVAQGAMPGDEETVIVPKDGAERHCVEIVSEKPKVLLLNRLEKISAVKQVRDGDGSHVSSELPVGAWNEVLDFLTTNVAGFRTEKLKSK